MEPTALKWVFYREVDVQRDNEEILVTGEVADQPYEMWQYSPTNAWLLKMFKG